MQPIIEIKNLGKKYKLGQMQEKYIALRDVLMNIIKHPFMFAKDKAEIVIGMKHEKEFWALKGINLSINKGEVVGIIGANGAGKSTLLKILTGITPPTEGEAILRGRVSSLLEVGTGFHPELTGRENIYLNGAILGMTKKEMNEKFDEIVEFSGIEKFLDTPVKRYSSGMYVRLAFSVAAHLEPDILLVDEVLAVGDAEFQKKCLGKMEEVTKTAGRTILFVSHNLSAIKSLCKKSILIERGRVKMFDDTERVVNQYLNGESLLAINDYIEKEEGASITKISILDSENRPTTRIPISQNFAIKIDYKIKEKIEHSIISLYIQSGGELVFVTSDSDKDGKARDRYPGVYSTTIKLPKYLLNVGAYSFDAHIHNEGVMSYDTKKNLGFEILDSGNTRSVVFRGYTPGKIASILEFKTVKEI